METLAARLEALAGGKPYIVAAGFHRRYIDANRPESLAFEDPDAAPYYAAYHHTIRRFVAEIRREHQAEGILIDIHSHAKAGFKGRVCRGTRDGATVERLVETHGIEALVGRSSVMRGLQAAGYPVFPPNAPSTSAREGECYDGGYTVVAYGSHNLDGIDALQLEIGWELVRRGRQVALTEALAQAIAGLLSRIPVVGSRGPGLRCRRLARGHRVWDAVPLDPEPIFTERSAKLVGDLL